MIFQSRLRRKYHGTLYLKSNRPLFQESKKTNNGKIHFSKQINPDVQPQLNPVILPKLTKMFLLLKNIVTESMTIPYSRFKLKQSLSLRSSVDNNSNSNFKLLTLLLRRTSQKEMTEGTLSRITRTIRERLSARTISCWRDRKIETMEERQIPTSKNHMVMNKKMKE